MDSVRCFYHWRASHRPDSALLQRALGLLRTLKECAIRTCFQLPFTLVLMRVLRFSLTLKEGAVRTGFGLPLFLAGRTPHGGHFSTISQIQKMSALPLGPPPLGCQKRKLLPTAGVFRVNAVVRVSFWPASGVPATFTHLSPCST